MEKIMVLVCIMSFTILGLSSAQEINHAAAVSLATAPAAAATPAAPAPSPASLNLSGILDKAGQFNTFLSLLKSTQVGMQLQSQLNNSQQGITIFAPSDAAFAALKPGALNSITDQDKIALLQYHALPSYYTFSQFQTVSNPVRTMASGNGGPFAAPTPEPGAPVSSPAVSPSGASGSGASTSSACGSMAALAKGLYLVFLAAGALVLVISS
uniref:Arabinogalactan-like protein n=1 Tax=Pinus taeda TaxID=3352 RepID=Q5UEF8_PINTA|nr:arabinogalactan-like protein [Pinus taeda]AAV30854.1 arabinogalactan-like protein [Pinus taeda]AAV30855.1 arabinogalactan-like protein [Pinus taeda]AAV30856.1 arabinogalactan-like protein [Pinus taeda]AAV30857.1 arabinogalactan-like protein [Pinus taeda]